MPEEPSTPQDPISSDLVREDASFADIVEEFVNGLDDRLKNMEQAVRASDFEALRSAAHQLKGSGGGYGYPVLTEHAARLEQQAKANLVDECFDQLAVLKDLVSRVVVGP
ncbi:MAG: Hpt domain-containing protein [Phycisphaerae bacterium]